MPVLLVRHAHAGSRKDAKGPDRDRPLTAKGRAQAAALAALAAPYAPQRLLSSPYARCHATFEPLAAELGITIEPCPALTEGAGPEAVALVRSLAEEKVALCTHGDVIPEVLVALADEDRLDLGYRPRQQKGSFWLLEATAGRFTKATYFPPGS